MKKLKRKLNDLFECGKKFFLETKISDKIALIYHRDVDGLSSASITIKMMEELGIRTPELFAATNNSVKDAIEKTEKFDKIIILDIDITYLKKFLVGLEKEILIFDHHPPRKDLNSEKIIYVNPHFEKSGIYHPTSYVLHKFFSTFLNAENAEWLAVLGTAADYGYEDCVDLMGKWMKIREKKDIWKTNFGRAAIVLNGAASSLGYENVLKELLKLKNIEDILKNKKIVSGYKKFLERYNKAKKQFMKNKKEFRKLNLIFSEIKSEEKQRLGSPLATELSAKHPNKIIMIIVEENGMCSINVRHNLSKLGMKKSIGKIHMGKLMAKCCRGIGGGGGHEKAAGGTILSNKKELFKSRVIKELKKKFLK